MPLSLLTRRLSPAWRILASLRGALLLAIGVAALLPPILILVQLEPLGERLMRQEVADRLQAAGDYTAERLRARLALMEASVTEVSRHPEIRAALSAEGQLLPLPALLAVAFDCVGRRPNVYLADTAGRVVARFPRQAPDYRLVTDRRPLAEVAAAMAETRRFAISSIDEGLADIGRGLFFAAPVFVEGEWRGTVAVRVCLAVFQQALQDNRHLGDSGEIVVGVRDGDEAVVINRLRLTPDAAFNHRIALGSPLGRPLQEAVSGGDGVDMALDYAGREVLAAWRYLPELDWGLVLKIDNTEALEGVLALREQVFLYLWLVFAATLVVVLVTGRLVVSPLLSIREGALRIAQGDDSIRVPPKGVREAQELGAAFNEMAAAVATARQRADKRLKDLGQATEALRASEEKFVALTEAAPDAITLIGPDDRILFWNTAAERIFGRTRDEALGQPMHDLIVAPAFRERAAAGLRHFRETGEGPILNRVRELQGVRADGSEFPLELSVSAVRLEGGYHAVGIMRDISDRKEKERALAEVTAEARKLALVASRTDNAVIITDARGLTEWVNDAFTRITGYTLEEAIGKKPGALLQGPDTDQAVVARMRETLARHEAFRGEILNYTKDGRPYWLAIEIQPVFDADGKLINFVAIESDITERKEMIAELERRAQELARVNAELVHAGRLKDEFMATISHELRTPLNSILSLTEVLREEAYGELTRRQGDYLDTIIDSGRHLLSLINDILDFAKIEAGQMQLNMTRIAVADLCERCLGMIREQAERKGLTAELSGELSGMFVEGDPKRLRQVLINLLDNAVEFTPPGGHLGLHVQRDQANQRLELQVWDSGIGIAQDDQDRLFQSFVQLDAALDRAHEGTGLGLALVRRLTQLHGGEVRLDSVPGEGSCFTISLPWKGGSEVVGDAGSEGGELRRVLLVEDEETNIMVVRDYLLAKGFEVLVARNGAEALAVLDELSVDIVLMDIQMPVMDGLETMRRLRADPRFARLPILALTALAMPGDDQRCFDAGATAYLSKPAKPSKLLEQINDLLGTR